MSERCFSIPLDFESRPWFRGLVAELQKSDDAGCFAEALREVVTLFRDLGYAAETERLGFLPAAQGQRHGALEACGLLKRSEQPPGWQCDLFARLNPDLDAEYEPTARKGGFARAVSIGWRKAKEEAAREPCALDLQGLFVGMDAPEVNRAMALVKMVDNVYRRAARKPLEWSDGLKESARLVLKRYGEETIERVMTRIYGCVRDARLANLPKNTEELLRDFERYV